MPNYREMVPTPHLAGQVECFWIQTAASSGAHRVLPDGCADILYTRDSSNGTLYFVGPMTRFVDVPQQPGSVTVGIRFRPGMWSSTVARLGGSSTDRVISLEDLWGKRATQLRERLENTTQTAELVSHLSNAIRPETICLPVQSALTALERSRGTLSVEALASRSGLSTRQFRRRCIELAGLSPKLLARILRFRHAHSCLALQMNAAAVAQSCGYFDQSHLIADCREFADRTPRDLAFPDPHDF